LSLTILKSSRSNDNTVTDWLSRWCNCIACVRRSWETVHPWGSGGVFPAFPDRDLAEPAEAYYGSNLPRLRTNKARYDPANVFQPPSGQAIPPD